VVIVKIYDPMDRMVYRHVGQQSDSGSRPVAGTAAVVRLPAGYANGSPVTYLGSARRASRAA
jgi:hypothetical protein